MGTLVFQATLGGAVNIIGPNIANTINFTLPSADGTSGQTWTTNGSGVLSFGTLGIAGGGTGQITATAAFNALAPSQSGQSGKYLTTDGTNTSWGTNPLGTVTSVAVSGGTTGLTTSGGPITTSGTITFAGTLATSNGGTGLSGATPFTSGGVVYASSSSALATGSALTYNGTSLSIGISASSPASRLNVSVGNVSTLGAPASMGLSIDSNDNNIVVGNLSQIGLGLRNVYQPSYISYIVTSAAAYSKGDLVFGTRSVTTDDAPSERLRITSAGNVGIGTSSPVKPLHIISSSGPQILMEPSLGSGNTELMIGRGYSLSGTPATVGTKSFIQCAFEGSDDNAYSPFGYVTTAVGNRVAIATAFYIETKSAGASAPAERMRIDSSGNLLVGTTSALAGGGKVQVLGATTTAAMTVQVGTDGYPAISFNNAAGSQQGYIQTNSSTVLYVSVSDYRLKNTIAPMTGALAKVAQLKPVTYKWNLNGSDGQGFIAHELAEVCPDAVSGQKDAVDANGNPKYQGIDTSFLVATLTAAIQEQQAIIESLKARLDAANL